MREVIGRRLNRLSERCNRVLTVASVIGREFDFKLLSVLNDISEGQLLEVIEEALNARVIEEAVSGAERYQFSHALIRQTLYEEITTSRRVRLHARIGEALEKLHRTNVEPHASELAYHFSEAEPVTGAEKLVRCSLMAGEQALAAYAWEEALAHFERALAAKEGQPMDTETADILYGLGLAQHGTSERFEIAKGIENLVRAFDFYDKAGNVVRVADAARYVSLIAPISIESVTRIKARALELVPPESIQAGRILPGYAYRLALAGNHEAANKAFSRALSIAKLSEDSTLEVQTLHISSNADIQHFHYEECLEKILKAVELSDRNDDHWSKLDTRAQAMGTFTILGDPRQTRRYGEPVLAAMERRHGRDRRSLWLFYFSDLSRLLGDWQTARDYSNRGLKLAPRLDRLLYGRIIVEYELGEFSEGEIYLERLLDTNRSISAGSYHWLSIIPLTIALVSRITGDTDRFDIAEDIAQVWVRSTHIAPYFPMSARLGLAIMAV